MELKYNESYDFYTVGSDFKTVEVRLANKDTVLKFMNGEYDDLFEDFKPESDSVEPVELAGEVYFIHTRSQEKVNSGKEVFGRESKSDKRNQLPSGIYKFDYKTGEGLIIKPFNEFNFDDYINLSNSDNTIEEDISKFFESEEIFEKYGMEFSRGSLAYGPQGTGKSMAIKKSVNELVERRDDTVAFIITSDYPRYFDELSDYKKIIEGNQNVVFIIEEITEQAEDFETILSFLDGEHSWTRSYNIATTNYPNRVPENVIDRPGRFDSIYEFGNPGEQDRRKYFKKKGIEPSDELIQETEGFSVAHLKEVIVGSELHDKSMLDVVKEFKELKQKIKNGFADSDQLDEDKVSEITRS